jgi:hypothetical protein
VHIAVLLHARMPAPSANTPEAIALAFRLSQQGLDKGLRWLRQLISSTGDGVTILGGHRGPDGELLDYQDVQTVLENGIPTAKEHFGYTDGIGDPVISGVPYDADRVAGRGKQMENGNGNHWPPVNSFSGIWMKREYPPAPLPRLLARNGTLTWCTASCMKTSPALMPFWNAKLPNPIRLKAARNYWPPTASDAGATTARRWSTHRAPAAKKAFDQRFAAASAQGRTKCSATSL